MSMHFREIADRAAADGAITPDEILALRREGWADGRMTPDEAEAVFVANDHLSERGPEWADFFVEAIGEFLVHTLEPKGYVSEDQAEWLLARIDHDHGVETLTELNLLARVFEKAVRCPDRLKTYALSQIEQAVLTGEGPTRKGDGLDPGSISAAEVDLMRRFIFASGGDRPAAVSRAEAEALFRIKDASLGADNAPGWQTLFVQGVGNYLQGFGGKEPLDRARAAELEAFMNNTAFSIGGFMRRMLGSNPANGLGAFIAGDESPADLDAAVAQAASVTDSEQLWLQGQLDADDRLDDLEKALLEFLAETD